MYLYIYTHTYIDIYIYIYMYICIYTYVTSSSALSPPSPDSRAIPRATSSIGSALDACLARVRNFGFRFGVEGGRHGVQRFGHMASEPLQLAGLERYPEANVERNYARALKVVAKRQPPSGGCQMSTSLGVSEMPKFKIIHTKTSKQDTPFSSLMRRQRTGRLLSSFRLRDSDFGLRISGFGF